MAFQQEERDLPRDCRRIRNRAETLLRKTELEFYCDIDQVPYTINPTPDTTVDPTDTTTAVEIENKCDGKEDGYYPNEPDCTSFYR